jgi:hypothetical protein
MLETNSQYFIFFVVINLFDFLFFITKIEIIRTDATSAITPPSFEGTDRKIT